MEEEREIVYIPKAWIEFKRLGKKKNYLCSLEVVEHIETLQNKIEEAHDLLHKCNSSDANVDRAIQILNDEQ